MHAVRLAAAVLLAFWSLTGNATDLSLKDQDCAKILERWARDPASVPKHLVDRCKEQMAEAAPPPVAPVPQAAAVDPCAGPNAAASVLCWGPWAVLAPAAEGPVAEVAMPKIAEQSIDCSTAGDISDQCVPQLQAEPVLSGCPAGTPCGFATIVAGATSNADVEETSFVRFDMQPDGSSFTVDPDGANEINSVPMTAIIGPGAEGYENMRATGVSGDEQSNLVARVARDDQGEVALASGDVWRHGNRQTRVANSGYFAWGVATTQSALDSLNASALSVSFSGPMSVNNSTTASMTVNFGSQPNWAGTWTNPAWSFGAGGAVTGANLMSNPAQFTQNVESGSFVQGALLGEPGRQGVAHIIDVRLAGTGHIKDVGLLREVGN
jgi:hypothetical protein